MADAIIRFERESIEGAVAPGSSISAVMRRFGIRTLPACSEAGTEHHCEFTVISGAEHLSEISSSEMEHMSDDMRNRLVRLACFANVVDDGEVVIMTERAENQNSDPNNDKTKTPGIVEEFEALPLEKKIADLMRMEAVALGETISFVINSPFKAAEKVIDVLAEFGMKLDRPESAQSPTEDVKPEEKATKAKTAKAKPAPPKRKTTTRRTPKPPAA